MDFLTNLPPSVSRLTRQHTPISPSTQLLSQLPLPRFLKDTRHKKEVHKIINSLTDTPFLRENYHLSEQVNILSATCHCCARPLPQCYTKYLRTNLRGHITLVYCLSPFSCPVNCQPMYLNCLCCYEFSLIEFSVFIIDPLQSGPHSLEMSPMHCMSLFSCRPFRRHAQNSREFLHFPLPFLIAPLPSSACS